MQLFLYFQGEQDSPMSISLLQTDESVHIKVELNSKSKTIKLSTGSSTVQLKEVFAEHPIGSLVISKLS